MNAKCTVAHTRFYTMAHHALLRKPFEGDIWHKSLQTASLTSIRLTFYPERGARYIINPDNSNDAVGMFNGPALVFMGLGPVGDKNAPLEDCISELVRRIHEFGIVVEQVTRIVPVQPGSPMIQLMFLEKNIPYGGRRRVVINWYTRSGLAFMFADAPSFPGDMAC